MKFNQQVSSSRRRCRKAHFSAPSSVRRKLMSAPLSKELRDKYHVRSMPIRRDDKVIIVRGGSHKNKSGRVSAVYRKKWCIHIDMLTSERANGQTVQIPFDASKVRITELKMNKDRQAILDRKNRSKAQEKGKGKHTEAGVAMATKE